MNAEDAFGEGQEDTLGYYSGKRNADGERHGEGWAILPNGDFYRGCYFKGLRNCRGMYVFMKNGSRYEGDWRKGQKYGVGVMYYPDGSKYEGDWKHDNRHGFGAYYYTNNDVYEGAWYKGQKHGLGTYFFAADQIKYMGTWIEGRIEGPGQVVYPKYRFHGAWYKNRPKGTGAFVFKSQCMLHGFYKVMDDPALQKGGEEEEGREQGPAQLEGEQQPEPDDMEGKITAWRARNVTKYLAELLPEPAVPLPIVDSMPSLLEECVVDDTQSYDLPSVIQEEEQADGWLKDRENFVTDELDADIAQKLEEKVEET